MDPFRVLEIAQAFPSLNTPPKLYCNILKQCSLNSKNKLIFSELVET